MADDLVIRLIAKQIPRSLCPHTPRMHGSYPLDLDVDEHGYPSDAALDAIRCIGFADAESWLRNQFVHFAHQLIPYGVVRVTDGESKQTIFFATSGWSGCEDFISAVLNNVALRRFWVSSARGGAYTFELPNKDEDDDEDEAEPSEDNA